MQERRQGCLDIPCHFEKPALPGPRRKPMSQLLGTRLRARWRLVASTTVFLAVLRTWLCATTRARLDAPGGPSRTNRASLGLRCGHRFGTAPLEGARSPSRQILPATPSMPLLAAVRIRMACGLVPLVWRSLLSTPSRRPTGRGGNLANPLGGPGPPAHNLCFRNPV